ncbi:MAG TPA: ABC transporter substrate-binding protein [Kiloniellales bacterium]|nr:ABC transporter substrate-binding protein [Kiloniellales bacterium]
MNDTSNATRLRVIAFPGAPNLPIFAAQEMAFFAERGLEVDLATTPSSVFQFEKLAAGEFDLAMTAFDNVVAYREGQGAVELGGAADFCVLMGATQIELAFVVEPGIERYADLKGRSLALDALATGFAFVLYEMLARGGLERGDCELVPVGATPDRWQSVRDGVHAGTLTIEPFTSLARAAGFQVLERSTDLFDAYQGGVVAARRTRVEHNRPAVRAYLEGYLAGLDWTRTPENRTEAARLLMSRMPAIRPGVVDAVMDSLLSPRTGLTPDGAVLRDGMETVLALRSRYGGGAALEDVERYLELACYDEALAARRAATR